MKSPSSAAPALSVNTTTSQAPGVVSLPLRSDQYKKPYSPVRVMTIPSGQESYSNDTLTRTSYQSGYGHVVYQALQRDKLLRGGEERLSLAIMFIATICGVLAVHLWSPYLLGLTVIWAWPVQWGAKRLAAHDPQYFAILLRAIKHPLMREPH
jgi:type IV secretory pathway TrbD component